MKVLDLFCGLGGWSQPLVDDGAQVTGLDIQDFSGQYPGNFVQVDLTGFHPDAGYDLFIGSPPCRDFSRTTRFGKTHWKVPANAERGKILVREFKRIVDEGHPRFWAMENVTEGEQFINPIMGKPKYRFRISRQGWRSLWTNFPIPMSPDYSPDGVLMKDKKQCNGKPIVRRSPVKSLRNSANRAKIPYPIARFIADVVTNAKQEDSRA